MTFTEELIESAKDIWQDYYAHPFVNGMIDGTLDKAKFCRYLIQDTLYLNDYAKVYAQAFIKARDVRIMRHLYSDMNLINSEEDMMHIQYLKEFGYSEERTWSEKQLPGCRDYVNYMNRVAFEGTCEEGIMAVLPCALSYYYIGLYCMEEAKKRGTLEGNYFRNWMEEYGGDGYKQVFDSSSELCNKVTANATEEQKARYIEIFRESSRFEVGFWDMSFAD